MLNEEQEPRCGIKWGRKVRSEEVEYGWAWKTFQGGMKDHWWCLWGKLFQVSELVQDRAGPRRGSPDPTVKHIDLWGPDHEEGQHIWLCDFDKMSEKWKQMVEQSLEV